jgi:hypothetical protein
MNCHEAARHLPGYLDGATEAHSERGLRDHLQSCGDCRGEVERYRVMSVALANLERVAVPGDLALKIRIQASKARPWHSFLRSMRMRWTLVFGNVLKPLAVPATGGVLTALALFILALQSLMVGIPLGGPVADDQPLNLVQPAQLESFGPLPAPVFEADEHGYSSGMLLEATVNAQGQAVNYKILSGPTDVGVTRQIDQVMLLSRFRPLLSFGRPTDGGRVRLYLNAIRVRG